MTAIESIAALPDIIKRWEAKFLGDGGYPPIWYRGQANDAWDPLPGTLRPRFIETAKNVESLMPDSLRSVVREKTINKCFERIGASFLPSVSSLVETYLLAQHHGLPTRLLDWTTNPLAALYFAATGDSKHDGALYVVNPRFYIPSTADEKYPADIVNVRHRCVTQTVAYLFGEAEKPEHPIILPVIPDQTAGRIFQQSSCFTLYMVDAPDCNNETLEKLTIPKNAKPSLLRQLRRLSITSATLFADLDNVAKEIKSAFNL